jgi:hypothetical protein|tara:strand:- start:139 stop:552 length:414 start_codon:yes stop_codon:yes gene_type:complete
MADTLVYSSTTITFDGIQDYSRSRQAMNSKDFGGVDGVSRQASSNRSQATVSVTFILRTDDTYPSSGQSVRQKVKAFANAFKSNVDKTWTLTLDMGDAGTVTYTGLITGENGSFQGGTGAVRYLGTISMNVATETFS